MAQTDPEKLADTPITMDPAAVGHAACEYFVQRYGNPGNEVEAAELINIAATDPALSNWPEEPADLAVAHEAWQQPRDNPLTPAEWVLEHKLQCATCIWQRICPIHSKLVGKAEHEAARREDEQVNIFASGPEWLIRAQAHKAKMTMKEVVAFLSTPQNSAPEQRYSTLAKLRDGITARQLEPLAREALPPKLRDGLTSAKRRTSFETYEITFEDSPHTIIVSDLMSSNGFDTKLRPPEDEFGTMLAKLVNAMRATGSNAQAQIFDAHLQKVVRNFDGGYVAEIRMGGKNRLYIAAIQTCDAQGVQTTQILLIGAHRSSEKLQQIFYDQTGLISI